MRVTLFLVLLVGLIAIAMSYPAGEGAFETQPSELYEVESDVHSNSSPRKTRQFGFGHGGFGGGFGPGFGGGFGHRPGFGGGFGPGFGGGFGGFGHRPFGGGFGHGFYG